MRSSQFEMRRNALDCRDRQLTDMCGSSSGSEPKDKKTKTAILL